MKTLYELLETYLDWRRSLKLSPMTIRKNRHGIMLFIKWLGVTSHLTNIDQIRTDHLHAWQKHLASMTVKSGHPAKPRTINAYVENVKSWLGYLSTLGYIRKGLDQELKYVKVPYRLPGSVLTHAQMRKVLAKIPTGNATGYRDRAMLELLYSAGIRAGELLGLDVDHLDLKNRTIMVTGKGNKERIVPFGRTSLM